VADEPCSTLAETDWLAKEVLLLQRRVLKRLDLSAQEPLRPRRDRLVLRGVALELALAADRVFMQDDADGANAIVACLP
jgi:benzoyl-CoA-dihydrodiol lyase